MYRDRQEFHTDRISHMMECTGTDITGERNAQGTDITSVSKLKLACTGNVNFGQGHSLSPSDKATFWIIELLTLQLKKVKQIEYSPIDVRYT